MKDFFDDDFTDRISQDFRLLSDKERKRVYSMSRKKYLNGQKENETRGRIYSRPRHIVTGIASAVIVTSGIGSITYLLSRQVPPAPYYEVIEVNPQSHEKLSAVCEAFAEMISLTECFKTDSNDTITFNIEHHDGTVSEHQYSRLIQEKFSTSDEMLEYFSENFTRNFIDSNLEYLFYSPDFSGYENGEYIGEEEFFMQGKAIHRFIDYQGKIYADTSVCSGITEINWTGEPVVTERNDDGSISFTRECEYISGTENTNLTISFYIVNENDRLKIDSVEEIVSDEEQARKTAENLMDRYEYIIDNISFYGNCDPNDTLTYTEYSKDGSVLADFRYQRYTGIYSFAEEIQQEFNKIFTPQMQLFFECNDVSDFPDGYTWNANEENRPQLSPFVNYNGNLYVQELFMPVFDKVEFISLENISERSFSAKFQCRYNMQNDYFITELDIAEYDGEYKIESIRVEDTAITENPERTDDLYYSQIAESLFESYLEYLHVFRYPYGFTDRSDVIYFTDNETQRLDKPYHRFVNEKYTDFESLENLLRNTFTQGLIDFAFSDSIGSDMSSYAYGEEVPHEENSYNFIMYNGNLYCNEPGITPYYLEEEYSKGTVRVYDITENSFTAVKDFGDSHKNISIEAVKDDNGKWLIRGITEMGIYINENGECNSMY